VKSLRPEDLAFLEPLGFDAELFAAWRAAVRDGRLSTAHNVMRGALAAPPADALRELPRAGSREAAELEELGRRAIRAGQLGVVILNGGMATRFGGVVKGVVEVIHGLSFLGLKLTDVRSVQEEVGGEIPVFLMNSFATAEATAAHLREHGRFGLREAQVEAFQQFVSVRMEPNGDIFTTDDGGISPYGTGHGDCVPAFRHHGCLARFLARGGAHLFVANVDNLGARVSPLILGHHIAQQRDATVELAPKQEGDVGGAPYLVDGELQLVEQLRYPSGFDAGIVDVFNTNTFHFRAAALDREFDLGWYHVKKTVEGRPAVQIERLIGEMTRFLPTNYLRVGRSGPDGRFFPVKTPEDLASGRDQIRAMYGGR
jgi:UTP--glucose-1-phosphate uridylyltransferase